MNIIDLGRRDYKDVWDMQKTLHEKRVAGDIQDTLLLVEHDHVITLGKSGKEKNVLVPMKLLAEKGVAYYEIERGGDVTYHGPGQLVGYPIFNIKEHLIGIKPFIEKLQSVVIRALEQYDIQAHARDKMIGVWTAHGKICSIGVAVKRWVSFHGFALNVNTDLSYFNLINPCGMRDVNMTSMKEITHETVDVQNVKKHIIDSFAQVFEQEAVAQCLSDLI
ncbi:MAG: lipoyl(octanoyl) transferase LipB [candidate division WOR-3 bacterium]|nr:MAG: lipoyl(octanoyl) transferase LipB [candidate division WOR-3 bacterium]